MQIGRMNRSVNSIGRMNVRRRDKVEEDTAIVWATTTTPNETVTLNRVTPSGGDCLVDWGDDSQSTIIAGTTAAITHVYASAGMYKIAIYNPELITYFWMQNNKLTVNSSEISSIVNVNNAQFNSLKAGTFNSADVSAWRPTYFYLYSMPAGYTGTFDSADVSAWRLTNFLLHSMPAGYTGTFDSADVSAWRLTSFYLYSMPAGYTGTFDSADVSAWRPTSFYLSSMPAGYSFTITASGFSAWTSIRYFYMHFNNLNSTQIDQILEDLWDAFPARTQTNGRIRIQNNAVPGGTYQAANPPTTGMEYKYELQYDTQNINPTYKWIEVTTDT